MAQELATWLQTRPSASDLHESAAGWHKKFSSFPICGEGEFVKTLFYDLFAWFAARGSVDLDERKPPAPTRH
jgi:hypothetical protein